MGTRPDAAYWIKKLSLTKHEEGGYFAEVYRSNEVIDSNSLPGSFKGTRNISTSIYFLLEKNQVSAFHRIKSDELWHFYYGDPLTIYEIEHDGKLAIHELGNDPEHNQAFQCVIKAGNWFAAKVNDGGAYTLAGCTVAPGFDFTDFELAVASQLSTQYPQHRQLINDLSRE